MPFLKRNGERPVSMTEFGHQHATNKNGRQLLTGGQELRSSLSTGNRISTLDARGAERIHPVASLPPALRSSPARTVHPVRSQCSSSGTAYLRLTPIRSLNVATLSVDALAKWGTSFARSESICFVV